MTKNQTSRKTEVKLVSPATHKVENKPERTLREIVKEPSTIAGVLTIVSQALMAGPGALVNPGVWAGVLAGVGLIFTREG